MSLQVNDVRDLIRLLAEHPEWRAELRPLILGDELDRLPAVVAQLAEAQQRTETRVAELAEAQRRTEARLEELAEAQRRTETRVAELAEAQRRTEVRLEELAEAQRRTQAGLSELAATVDRLGDKVDRLVTAVEGLQTDRGVIYEILFERKAPSVFGKWLRRPRVVTLSDLDLYDEAETAGTLSRMDAGSLRALDLIVAGGDKQVPGYPETLLAVEVSRTLDLDALDRAEGRSRLLEAVGYRSRPAVGGKYASERIQSLATERNIILELLDTA